jgi:hypothetical protein
VSDINGIFQGDLIVKATVELSIDDMRKNPWIVEDVFSSLLENPILKLKYGLKEITRAKEFILNNNIPVYMRHRVDKMEYPCVTISIGQSQEDKELATLGDASIEFEDLSPFDIGKPIKFIIPAFQPVSYDITTGIVEVPENIEDYQFINTGMVAVDVETGNGFIVIEKAGTNGFRVAPNSAIPKGKIGIVPQYQLWRARRERAIFQEQYNIGCHVHGDPSTLIFLFGVVKYALMRYREGLLEHNNFQLSKITCTDMIKNDMMDVENVFSRWITLSGQCEESWIKAPHRFIEGFELNDPDNELDAQLGLKILEKQALSGVDENGLWTTIDEE